MQKIKVNDEVVVIAGKDKGKSGKIMRILKKQDKVVVEKVNIRKKHIKRTPQQAGQIIEFEAPIHISNVMVKCPDTKKPTRVGIRKLDNNKQERFAKVSGASLDKKSSAKPKAKAKK